MQSLIIEIEEQKDGEQCTVKLDFEETTKKDMPNYVILFLIWKGVKWYGMMTWISTMYDVQDQQHYNTPPTYG